MSNLESNKDIRDTNVNENKKSNKKSSFFSIYQSLMIKYPYYMNASQAAVINALSVITSQYISHDNETKSLEIEWNEVLVMMIIAVTFITPIILLFYKYLEKLTIGGTFGKLFIDQALFSPIFTCGIIAYRLVLLKEVDSVDDLVKKVLAIAPSAVTSSWLFWIPTRYFTLLFIPSMYQLIFGNIFAYIWNILFNLIISSK